MNFLIKPIAFPQLKQLGKDWQVKKIYKGIIGLCGELTIHTSTLQPNILPHVINSHIEEEIIMIVRGDVEIITSESPESQANKPMILSPGSIVYHSTGQYHTLRCVGPEAAQYLIFKWQRVNKNPLRNPGTFLYDGNVRESDFTAISDGFKIFQEDGLSNFTNGALRLHFSRLEPGAGNKMHRDNYDIIAVLFEGDLESYNLPVKAPAFLFFAAGTPHRFLNPGTQTAAYVVFEFTKIG
jgi:hypothetical protein